MSSKAKIVIAVLLSATVAILSGGLTATTSAGQSGQSGQGSGGVEKPQAEGPPLPFHTVEGYGGGAITPMAYLVNPGAEGTVWGKPAVAFSSVVLGHKNLQALTITETVFGRLELGYGVDRLGLGTLPDDIEDATTVDIGKDEVWLHNFNARYLLLKAGEAAGADGRRAFQGEPGHRGY